MVDIRPHRRLAVLFRPPRFNDLVDVSDFLSVMYEHVGVACFDMFAYTSVAVLKRMCDSIGLKLLVDCPDVASSVRAAADGADFVTVRPSSIPEAHCFRCEILVSVADDMGLELVKVSAAKGVYCDSSFVGRAAASLGPEYTVFSSGGDVVQAVKDGARFATVGDPVLMSKDPAHAARHLAEDFREFT